MLPHKLRERKAKHAYLQWIDVVHKSAGGFTFHLGLAAVRGAGMGNSHSHQSRRWVTERHHNS